MDNPLVSVLMTVYNKENFIKESILSVLNQTYSNFELLIYDDCSTDGSYKIIKEFDDERILCHQGKVNKGTIASLNFLIDKAKGDYVAVLDSDDVWTDNKLKKQLSFMLKNPDYSGTFTQAEIIDENGKKYPEHENADLGENVYMQQNMSNVDAIKRFFYIGNCFAHPSLMLKKSVFDNIGKHDIRFRQLHDLEFYTRLFSNFKVCLIEEVLLKVRRISNNNDSISAQSVENAIRSRNEMSIIIYNMIDGLSKKLFEEAFADKIIKTINDDIDLICEKYFVLKQWEMDNVNNILPAMLYISENIQKKDVLERLENKYSYNINSYYDDMAKVIQLYQPIYYPSFKKELDVIYNSGSWKITKPIRALKKLLK